jgi:hypothetical protein
MKILVLAVLVGCNWSWTGVAGSGTATRETRTPGDFTEVEVACALDAEIVVGGERRVELSGDDNLLPLITTEVRGGRLVIGTRKNIRPKSKLALRVAAPQITVVEVSGSGDVTLHGARGDKLTLDIAGSATIRGDGAVRRLSVNVSGSGDVEVEPLAAEQAEVVVAGSGDVSLSASRSLAVTISGSGDVSYRGDPEVKKTINGSGSLHKR